MLSPESPLQNLLESIRLALAVSVHGDLCAPPRAAAPESIRNLKVGRVCSQRFMRSPEPPLNLSGWPFFCHVQSYVLINHRYSCAILYVLA